MSPRQQNFFIISRDWLFNSMPGWSCYVWLPICKCLTYQLAIFFQFTSDTTTYLMHPTTEKLELDGIAVYTLSANSTRGLDFFCKLPSIFTTNHHFGLLSVYSNLTTMWTNKGLNTVPWGNPTRARKSSLKVSLTIT